MKEPTNISEALLAAVKRLEETAGNATESQDAVAALKEIAGLQDLTDIEAPQALVEQIEQLHTPQAQEKRSGASFLSRPVWLEGRDLFTLAPASDEFSGWRSPSAEDEPLLTALEQQLHQFSETLADPDPEETESEETDEQEISAVQIALRAALDGIVLAEQDILLTEPPFLPDVTLIHLVLSVEGIDQPLEGLFYGVRNKQGEWDTASFDYTSDKLHLLNREYNVRVAGNELTYLRYFLQVVRADAGAFRVIDHKLKAALESLLNENPDKEHPVEEIFADWHPLSCTGVGFGGGLQYEAYLLYGGAVFWALFEVRSDGMVEMLEDEPKMTPRAELREV